MEESEKDMEDGRSNGFPKSYAMNGGDGRYSYAQNSNYQRGVAEVAKEMMNEAIAKKFDIKTFSASLDPIRIADLGCSTGPNTFLAVKNIVEAIDLKYKSEEDLNNIQIPEFQAFFNDHATNDFNTLFVSLPPNRSYFAAGLPGSFYGRLFPKATLHFIHSSCALNWLSEVPKEIMDTTSSAWNKGRIHYTGAPKEVVEAYETQFAMDFESFLNARAQELVVDGLMALHLPIVPEVILKSETTIATELDLLGSCLMDMAKMGLVITEEKVESFNFPIYFPTQKKMKAIIEKNGHFSTERTEEVSNKITPNVQMHVLSCRAALGGLIEKNFGGEIVDELFDRYSKKVAKSPMFLNPENRKSSVLFVLLQRKLKI